MTSRPVVLATPVSSAMPSAGAPAASASVSGPPKPARPPVTAARAVFTCTTSRCWQDQCNVQVSTPATVAASSSSSVERTTDHMIGRDRAATTAPGSTSRYVLLGHVLLGHVLPAAFAHLAVPRRRWADGRAPRLSGGGHDPRSESRVSVHPHPQGESMLESTNTALLVTCA